VNIFLKKVGWALYIASRMAVSKTWFLRYVDVLSKTIISDGNNALWELYYVETCMYAYLYIC